jgi:mycothiol synthase
MGTVAEALTSTSLPVVVRPYAGPQDHPAMTAVANAVDRFNGAPAERSIAGMDTYYSHLDQERLPRDCALVERDGRVVAYGRASWDELANGDGQIGAILNIDPGVRGQGIEELLVRHAMRRAEELIPQLGQDRTTRVVVFMTERDTQQREAAERLGFRLVRSGASLIRPNVADIPDIPLPDGFEIRRIDPGDRAMHRRVYDAAKRAFEGSYGEEAPSENDFERFIAEPTFAPALWRVAFHGDDIAGQILNFMAEDRTPDEWIGYTESISVQPEFRRRGLARALLAESLRTVRDAGATKAALGVDLQNPNEARTLYESMGFRIVAVTHQYQLGPFPPGSAPRLIPEDLP